MKFKKIDHIALAVKSLSEAIKTFKNLGFTIEEPHEIPIMNVKAAFAKIGESQLEFLESLSPDSAVSKFLQKKGEGIHHICFEVSDIQKTLQDLKQKGFQLVSEKPTQGAQGLVAFIHPKSCHGVLIEVVEKNGY
ncbi:MAG: methylmalonyl-CoA epimerase [Deltaproteobacteria bacterium]|nr:methylmalonyl-CoA epimerase [Deltaproteobacteria bacterium]